MQKEKNIIFQLKRLLKIRRVFSISIQTSNDFIYNCLQKLLIENNISSNKLDLIKTKSVGDLVIESNTFFLEDPFLNNLYYIFLKYCNEKYEKEFKNEYQLYNNSFFVVPPKVQGLTLITGEHSDDSSLFKYEIFNQSDRKNKKTIILDSKSNLAKAQDKGFIKFEAYQEERLQPAKDIISEIFIHENIQNFKQYLCFKTKQIYSDKSLFRILDIVLFFKKKNTKLSTKQLSNYINFIENIKDKEDSNASPKEIIEACSQIFKISHFIPNFKNNNKNIFINFKEEALWNFIPKSDPKSDIITEDSYLFLGIQLYHFLIKNKETNTIIDYFNCYFRDKDINNFISEKLFELKEYNIILSSINNETFSQFYDPYKNVIVTNTGANEFPSDLLIKNTKKDKKNKHKITLGLVYGLNNDGKKDIFYHNYAFTKKNNEDCLDIYRKRVLK